MTELANKIFTEKYRPTDFTDLILENKDTIMKYIINTSSMPSFIFFSTKPGTGKTTTAKLIAEMLGCDMLKLNASDERGIDTIRYKIKFFTQSLSSKKGIKRMIFLDEADYLTSVAQASLRNIIEEMSNNAFFVFTANDISKIIEPIRSRCVLIGFDAPNREKIVERLNYICSLEQLNGDMEALVDYYYPDIRRMISILQEIKITGKPWKRKDLEYMNFLEALKRMDIDYIYQTAYSTNFDKLGFNKWLFNYIFINNKKFEFITTSQIATLLADTEKNWSLGSNITIIFIANMLKIGAIL